MRRGLSIVMAAFFGIISGSLFSQSDSLQISQKVSASKYFGFGGGYGTCGSTWGLKAAFVYKKGWGFGFSVKTNIVKSKDTPDDYYSDGYRVFAPKDYLTLYSADMIKEFSLSGKPNKIGIEAGVSLVKYNIAQFSLNPSYDPEASIGDGGLYLYDKSHSATRTIGLDLRVKAELAHKKSTIIELALYSNINTLRPVVGLEMYICFGGKGK